MLASRVAISVVALTALLAACKASARADAVRVSAVADSASADSAALASLPPTLAHEFAVPDVLTAESARDTARVTCEQLGTPDAIYVRRQLRVLLPDSA